MLILGGGVVGCSTAVRHSSSPLPTYYLHAGFCSGFTPQGGVIPERMLCTRIRFDEPFLVVSDSSDTNSSWDYNKLAGRIDWHGVKLVADLMWSCASQSQFYKGNITPEKPFFAQGGVASGFIMGPTWFLVSTNFDKKPVLEKIKDTNLRNAKEQLPP
jgi:hypothetical protein